MTQIQSTSNGSLYRLMKLSDFCYFEKGSTPIQKAVPGQYPLVVTTSERRTSSTFQFDKPAVCIPLISSRGHGVASLNEVFYQDGKFALGNILCGVIPDTTVMSAKFLSLYLNYKKDSLIVPLMRGGANVSLSIDSLKNIRVPIPPLIVQEQIIKKLDIFTTFIAELIKELTARKKQYEFYRDKLLSFDDRTPEESKNLGIRWMALGDISEIYDGVHQTPDYTSQGVKFVSVEDIDNLYSSNKYISAEDYERDYKHPAHKGDLFMTRIGSIGKCTVLTQDEMLAYYVTLALIRPKTDIVSSDYLKHIIESNIGKRELYKRTLIHATPIKINLGDIGKIMLPIPSIEHQNKLTAILNNFEKLTIDLNEGLPAEIEARQKQYEYYRDKLLSFS